MQELKCHGSPGKNSSFNLCWSQNTQLCRAGMLAHQGVLEHSPLQSTTTATLLESPLVFKSDSLWHFPSEREKAAEKQGNPFQHLSHCSLQKWGHRKKKKFRMWLFKFVRKEHPPTSSSSSEAFHYFCGAQAQILAAGFCVLVKKQDLHLCEAHGQHSGSLFPAGPLPENTPMLQPV